MNFIKKIFEGKIDEFVHNRFTRFGKGTYEKRAVCKIKAGKKVKINATYEYANDLVEFFFTLADKIQVKGKILIKENFDFQAIGIKGEKKDKKGFYEIEIDQELNKKQVDALAGKVYYFLLNLSFVNGELKIKQKLPRASKGKGQKVDDKFCVAILGAKYADKAMQEFFFDASTCKSAIAEHTFEIKEIILPKKIENYEQARLDAKRKGKIIRKLTADGKESVKEKEFII